MSPRCTTVAGRHRGRHFVSPEKRMPFQYPLLISNLRTPHGVAVGVTSDTGSRRANIAETLSVGLRSMTRRTLSTEIAKYDPVNQEALSLRLTNGSSNGDSVRPLAMVNVCAILKPSCVTSEMYSRPLVTLVLVSGAHAVLTRQRRFLSLAELPQHSVYQSMRVPAWRLWCHRLPP